MPGINTADYVGFDYFANRLEKHVCLIRRIYKNVHGFPDATKKNQKVVFDKTAADSFIQNHAHEIDHLIEIAFDKLAGIRAEPTPDQLLAMRFHRNFGHAEQKLKQMIMMQNSQITQPKTKLVRVVCN